jgi:Kef-type K+ transport system membrane component KefB
MKLNRPLIGVGMIPRGEVGLIFAQMGLTSGVFDAGLFTSVTMVVMLTTFLTPPLLKLFAPSATPHEPSGIEDLVNTA